MKKKERAAYILQRLGEIYPEPPIPLDHTDSYTLLLAVLLSAQSTDKKVNEITPALFAVANTPEKMIELTQEQIQEYIKQIGLAPRKAKAIRGLSEILIEKHESQVPDDFETNTEFLRSAHRALLEIEVINGKLVCPESQRVFQITDGIPNMLLNEDEV